VQQADGFQLSCSQEAAHLLLSATEFEVARPGGGSPAAAAKEAAEESACTAAATAKRRRQHNACGIRLHKQAQAHI
jgi:hypothetical protein